MTMPFKRKLDVADLRRMNLPEEVWRVRAEEVCESVRRPVVRYLQRIDQMFREGVSLLIHGAPGVGKTAVAALVAKEARSRGYTVYFSSIWELRELIRARVMFDDDTTMLGRCREVDFLVLDDLRLEDVSERWMGLREIEGLVRDRKSKRKVTLITTQAPALELRPGGAFSRLSETGQGYLVHFPIEGPNRLARRQNLLKRAVFGE